MEFFVLAIWLPLCVVIAWGAEQKGLGGVGYFFLSLFLSPIVGLIGVALSPPNIEKIERRALRSGNARRCPACAELVRRQAIICRFCGADLPRPAVTTPAPVTPSPAVQKTAEAAGRAVARAFNRVEIITIIGVVSTGLVALYLYVR